jgi:hypothetical protein
MTMVLLNWIATDLSVAQWDFSSELIGFSEVVMIALVMIALVVIRVALVGAISPSYDLSGAKGQ